MKFYEHPAYIGFAEKGNSNNKRWKKQFEKQGFDDSATFSLDYSISQFIYPRLKLYYKKATKYLDLEKEFKEALENMIEGFYLASQNKFYTETEEKKVNTAWGLLSKWHNHLWW